MKNDTCALGEGVAAMAFSTFDSDDTAGSSPGCLSAGRSVPAVRALSLSEFFRVLLRIPSHRPEFRRCPREGVF